MAKNDSLLRSRDMAHNLDCSPDDVVEPARRKQLKGSKRGRFWRFRPADVKAYVKKEGK